MEYVKTFENFNNKDFVEISNKTKPEQFPYFSLENMVEITNQKLNLINLQCGIKFKKTDWQQSDREWSELRYSHNPLNTIVVYPMEDEYYDIQQYKNYYFYDKIKFIKSTDLSDELIDDYKKNGKQLLRYRCYGIDGLKKLLEYLGFI